MRCPVCSTIITVEDHRHNCPGSWGLDAGKYSIGTCLKENIIGTVDWLNSWEYGNQNFSAVIIEGISHTWYGKSETWERNLFLLERTRYITGNLDWVKVGDTVYMYRVTTSYGSTHWHATLIVSEEVIENAREEMRAALIAKYTRCITKAESRLATYKQKLEVLTRPEMKPAQQALINWATDNNLFVEIERNNKFHDRTSMFDNTQVNIRTHPILGDVLIMATFFDDNQIHFDTYPPMFPDRMYVFQSKEHAKAATELASLLDHLRTLEV